MRRNLIFDVGDVLIEYRWKEMLQEHGLSEEEAERVGGIIFNNNSWCLLDLGTSSLDEIIDQYRDTVPNEIDDVEWFLKHGELMHVPRPEIWERVHLLKQAGCSIYLLSNYSEDLFQKHTGGAPFHDDLDGMVISYQVHAVKPDPQIYQTLMDKYHLDPTTCIFMDDREDNTKAAEKFGIKTYTITSREYLRGVLDAMIMEMENENHNVN